MRDSKQEPVKRRYRDTVLAIVPSATNAPSACRHIMALMLALASDRNSPKAVARVVERATKAGGGRIDGHQLQ